MEITFASADDPAARAAWAQLLADFPAGRVHADVRWLDVLRRAYDVPCILALARDPSGDASAALAGYESRTLSGQRVFHSLRHGVLAREHASAEALLAAASSTYRARRFAEAVVGGASHPLPEDYRTSLRFALTLDLAEDPQQIWTGFRDKVRNTIRKGERSGVTVSRDAAHLNAFQAIHARTMTERRANVRPLDFFRTLFAVFGSDARLYSALADGRVCGAMVVVVVGDRAVYSFGAFDEHGRRFGANSLLLWHIARELAGEGVRSFDLGPSAQGSGAYRFKLHMGGQPQTLHYADLLHAKAPCREGDVAAQALAQSTALPKPLGRLDRMIECLPFAWRVRARTWLGRRGRLL
jgi:CelD/BcsL family acetyltransferase involved in cellulose biosynthesis